MLDARREAILRAGGSHPDEDVWEITRGEHTVTLFSDGRLLVSETRDVAAARRLLKEVLGEFAPSLADSADQVH